MLCGTGQVQVPRVQDERATWRSVDDRTLNELRADNSTQHRHASATLDQTWNGAALPARRLNVMHCTRQMILYRYVPRERITVPFGGGVASTVENLGRAKISEKIFKLRC